MKQNIFNKYFLDSQLKKELQGLSLNDLTEYKKNFFYNLYIEGYCTGYIEKNECMSTFKNIVDQLQFNMSASQIQKNLFQQQVKNVDHMNFELVLQNSNKVDNT